MFHFLLRCDASGSVYSIIPPGRGQLHGPRQYSRGSLSIGSQQEMAVQSRVVRCLIERTRSLGQWKWKKLDLNLFRS